MSDEEEDSMSEGFSASEDEWKPVATAKRGGESSDDDDSDYGEDEVVPLAGGVAGAAGGASAANRKRLESKARSSTAAGKQSGIAKKRKSMGQSLRSKLYNKYRPPPKTFANAAAGGSNSPSASSSRTASGTKPKSSTASKNARAPNESSEPHDNNDDSSSSDSSVEDYLVKPAELDLASSFFDVSKRSSTAAAADVGGRAITPLFDCNAGMKQLSDSGSEDNNESDEGKHEQCTKAFDFRHLLEKANSLERAKESIAKRAADASSNSGAAAAAAVNAAAMDVNSLLALGEKQCDDDDDKGAALDAPPPPPPAHKLNKTKSTRIKRHTKTRPNSTVLSASVAGGAGAADTDDSDFEEVADEEDHDESGGGGPEMSHSDSLEIHVELPNRQQRPNRTDKKQQDVEMALRRRLNRDLKDRQLLLHKTSLLCCFGRSYFYNKLLNDTKLMQAALKLLPSASAYPPERGTEAKYFQSLATWFKTAIKLSSQDLYPDKKTAALKRAKVRDELLQQLQRKEARCKQDMIFLFAILVRGMGLQCRLVVNMQPLPLRPAQGDLLSLSLKRPEDGKSGAQNAIVTKKAKIDVDDDDDASIKSKETKKVKVNTSTVEEKKLIKTLSKSDKETVKKRQEPKEKSKDAKETNKNKKEHSLEVKESHNKSKERSNSKEPKQFLSKSLEGKESHNQPKEKSNSKEPKHRVQHKLERKDSHESKEKSNSKEPKHDLKHSFEVNKSDNKSHDKSDLKELKHHVQKISASRLKTLDVEFTPVARRTRHASCEEKPNLADTKTTSLMVEMKKDSIEQFTQPEEQLPQSTANKLRKLTSLAMAFTPVARRTRHANDGKPAAKEDNKVKITSIKNTSKSFEEQKNEIPQKGKENVVVGDEVANIKADDDAQEPAASAAEKHIPPVLQKAKDRRLAKRPVIEVGSPVIPKIVVRHLENNTSSGGGGDLSAQGNTTNHVAQIHRDTRSRSKSPKAHISPTFLKSKAYERKFPAAPAAAAAKPTKRTLGALTKNANDKAKISTDFLSTRVTRSRKLLDDTPSTSKAALEQLAKFTQVPQFDGADDDVPLPRAKKNKRAPQLKNLRKTSSHDGVASVDSDDDFVPSPPKRPKQAPVLPKAVQALRKDRRVLSTDEENEGGSPKRSSTAADMWVEVWSDVEDQWICIDLFKGKINSVESIRKSAGASFAYVFAFQNDLSIKDVTARYCLHWTTTMRKSRVDQSWLEGAISAYYGHRTKRDLCEDMELRRIHESKPMPTAISDFKDNPLYALERHLLKFQAIYPPDAPTLGFVRGEAIYSRDCVHTLHSRDIWLKQARTVKLGETPYKIVKARPKWDRLTQTVIKDQPLEIFGYWQTQDYEPPTAENGMVPRNAYGNVELFKACMLPKKTAHVKLPGLNRVCRKLGIDCANAVIGFDFHQGACHPTYDGFVICEEFVDQVTAAWYQDQEEQDRREQEKFEARVYGNWKKLIRGLLIRERLKRKYNF